MPKNRTHFVRISYTEKDSNYPCQLCGYYTKSLTAMRLHRKSRHGITEKYDVEDNPVLTTCKGCGQKSSKCICSK